jgi:hypothetical protein
VGVRMEKRSHLGMAGHYAAMSEFLYRGYNVAVPAVDIGDDVYVVEDQLGTMWRLQVKTSDRRVDPADRIRTSYRLSRQQLREVKENELFFMFLVRWMGRWRFILLPREKLLEIREALADVDRPARRGRPAVPDGRAAGDALTLSIDWTADDAIGWGVSLAAYLDRWPEQFPDNPGGPGATGPAQ